MKKNYLLLALFLFGVITFTLQAQTITTIAGTGTPGYNGDGIAATVAQLYKPAGVLVDSSGNVIIVDFLNNRVRKVGTNGFISTIAGSGNTGYNGDNIAATVATLYNPSTPALDKFGNLYVNDGNNNRIRKVNTGGFISTIAGTGTYGYNGDNIAATSAQVNFPTDGMAVDTAGNVYFSDSYNHRVRKINTNGIITTIAGTGTAGYNGDNMLATSAQLNTPFGLTFDRTGNLYIADGYNHRIRKIGSDGMITTVAGTGVAGYNSDGITATTARLNLPEGVAIDAAGNIFISEFLNNRIRKVTISSSLISTVAGTGTGGYNGDNIAATLAQIYNPVGIAFDKFGNLYIADIQNHRIRKVDNVGPILPLTLTKFSGAIAGGAGLLQWQTTNEVNTQKFVIERSQDGISFTELNFVVAKSTNGNGSYFFTDRTIKSGSNYYRLKMVDKDGKFTYSEVIKLQIKESVSLGISPNPVGNTAILSFFTEKAGKYTIQIIGVDGKVIRQMMTNTIAGANSIAIDSYGFPNGEYLIRVTGADGNRSVLKFTK